MVTVKKPRKRLEQTSDTTTRNGTSSLALDRQTTLAPEKPKLSRAIRNGRSHSIRQHSLSAIHYSTEANRALSLIQRTGSVSIDLETEALHPHAKERAKIGVVIIKAGDERFLLRELPEWWKDVWEDGDIRKIGANLKFDGMWFIDSQQPVHGRNIQDLMIKSQISHRYRTYDGPSKAFPNKIYGPRARELWQPNDLKHILEEQLGITIKKEIHHEDVWEYEKVKRLNPETGRQKTYTERTKLLHKAVDWSGPLSDEMIEYCLEDIDYLEPANDELDRKIKASGQERVSWIENNTVFATAWMTYNGVTPDVSSWLDFIGRTSETGQRGEHAHLIWHLRKYFPEVTNFNSNPQMKAAVSKLVGSQLKGVDKFILKQLAPHYYPVKILQDRNRVATRLKNWGSEFLNVSVCKICERFHPDWRQIGAETMRFSCSKPNLQQIPREADYRKLFVATPGYKLVSLDYSAIEVLTAAIYANCPSLIEACATGDPHLATARLTSGDPDLLKSDYRRQNAKIVNFGLLFGGGKDGLINQARDLFDVYYSDQEAGDLIAQYYALYPELKKSRNRAYRMLDQNNRQGPVEVRTMVNMLRILEGLNRKPTSILNTIIQSTAGHGLKSSVRHIDEAGMLPYICMQVHDEFLFEIPEEFAGTTDNPGEYPLIIKECMIRGMKEVLGPRAPVKVDINIADWWT